MTSDNKTFLADAQLTVGREKGLLCPCFTIEKKALIVFISELNFSFKTLLKEYLGKKTPALLTAFFRLFVVKCLLKY